MISACVVHMMQRGGGVMLWGSYAGDTVDNLFTIQRTHKLHDYHNILQ